MSYQLARMQPWNAALRTKWKPNAMASRLHGNCPWFIIAGSSIEPTLRHSSMTGLRRSCTWQHSSSSMPSPSISNTSMLSARWLEKLENCGLAILTSCPMRAPDTGSGMAENFQSPVAVSRPVLRSSTICSRCTWLSRSWKTLPMISDGRPLPSQSRTLICR